MSCIWAGEAVVVEESAGGVWIGLLEREGNNRLRTFDLADLLRARSIVFRSVASRALGKEGSLCKLTTAIRTANGTHPQGNRGGQSSWSVVK